METSCNWQYPHCKRKGNCQDQSISRDDFFAGKGVFFEESKVKYKKGGFEIDPANVVQQNIVDVPGCGVITNHFKNQYKDQNGGQQVFGGF